MLLRWFLKTGKTPCRLKALALVSAESRPKAISAYLEFSVGGLLALLLDVLHDDLICNIAGAGCKMPMGPQVSAPKLPAQRFEPH